MTLSVLWLFNEPVPDIRFRWEEVESVARMRWSWPLRGIKFQLRREVVEENRRRMFYFFAWGKSFSQILDFVVAHDVRVLGRTERYGFLWMGE